MYPDSSSEVIRFLKGHQSFSVPSSFFYNVEEQMCLIATGLKSQISLTSSGKTSPIQTGLKTHSSVESEHLLASCGTVGSSGKASNAWMS